jgi:hypothetical protein
MKAFRDFITESKGIDAANLNLFGDFGKNEIVNLIGRTPGLKHFADQRLIKSIKSQETKGKGIEITVELTNGKTEKFKINVLSVSIEQV